MRIIEFEVFNFASYEHAQVNLERLGLTLVSGPTGVGKSTLMDMCYWLITGNTSKDGAADDVRSWFTDEATEGWILIETPTGVMRIERTRGGAGKNDLCYSEGEQYNADNKIRGKDMVETQKKINERLGIDPDLYLTGAYIHQFSQADTFFTAKAKERRAVLDKIANLEMPTRLAERVSGARKEIKKEIDSVKANLEKITGALDEATDALMDADQHSKKWEAEHKEAIKDMRARVSTYEQDRTREVASLVTQLEDLDKKTVNAKEFDARLEQWKKQLKAFEQAKAEHKTRYREWVELRSQIKSIEAEADRLDSLSGQCPTCLGPCANDTRAKKTKELFTALEDMSHTAAGLEAQVKNLEQAIAGESKLHKDYDRIRADQAKNEKLLNEFDNVKAKILLLRQSKNPHEQRLKDLETQVNPHEPQVLRWQERIDQLSASEAQVKKTYAELEHTRGSYDWLYDKAFEIRGMMLDRSVQALNSKINEYLERYFDADLRVELELEDQDKIEVMINNAGYACSFKQLSGGERCLLNFALKFSLMQMAEDRSGVSFSVIMLDEVLNGLDDGLKVKAFNLLQSLESRYDSILLIDHCEELKNLFTSRINICKNGSVSTICIEE